jgi:hypothetical protein
MELGQPAMRSTLQANGDYAVTVNAHSRNPHTHLHSMAFSSEISPWRCEAYKEIH